MCVCVVEEEVSVLNISGKTGVHGLWMFVYMEVSLEPPIQVP